MKKLLMIAIVFAAAVVCADTYEADMKAAYKSCTAVEWQNKNDAALAEAVKPEVLEAFVKDSSAAKALLSEVKGAYLTSPMKAVQIAAVTQFVMADDESWWQCLLFWQHSRADMRKLWAEALLTNARTAKDSYVSVFMLDQLRWCGYPCQVPALAVMRASSDKMIAEMATIVATELSRVK